eukprot:1434813-Pleurochrysis_carterae.AAC.1
MGERERAHHQRVRGHEHMLQVRRGRRRMPDRRQEPARHEGVHKHAQLRHGQRHRRCRRGQGQRADAGVTAASFSANAVANEI